MGPVVVVLEVELSRCPVQSIVRVGSRQPTRVVLLLVLVLGQCHRPSPHRHLPLLELDSAAELQERVRQSLPRKETNDLPLAFALPAFLALGLLRTGVVGGVVTTVLVAPPSLPCLGHAIFSLWQAAHVRPSAPFFVRHVMHGTFFDRHLLQGGSMGPACC